MMHDRITDHRHFNNAFARDARLFHDLADKIIERCANSIGHFDFAARIHHHVGNAAHQIFAEANLWVHQASRSERFAIIKIGKMRGDGRRANVHRNAVSGLDKARINRDNIVTFANGHSYFPLALAQCLLQSTQYGQIWHSCVNVPLRF